MVIMRFDDTFNKLFEKLKRNNSFFYLLSQMHFYHQYQISIQLPFDYNLDVQLILHDLNLWMEEKTAKSNWEKVHFNEKHLDLTAKVYFLISKKKKN